MGNAIPPNFIPACEKGFREAVNAGQLIGHPVEASCTLFGNGADRNALRMECGCRGMLCKYMTHTPVLTSLPYLPTLVLHRARR